MMFSKPPRTHKRSTNVMGVGLPHAAGPTMKGADPRADGILPAKAKKSGSAKTGNRRPSGGAKLINGGSSEAFSAGESRTSKGRQKI